VCRKGNLAQRVAAQGCLLGEQPERLKPELAIRHREWVRGIEPHYQLGNSMALPACHLAIPQPAGISVI
jgi:hypothetical protein